MTHDALDRITRAASAADGYRLLFEGSHDAVFLTSPDGRVIRANPEACRMFDMSEDEIRAAGRHQLVDLSDRRLSPLLEERERTGRAEGGLTFYRRGGAPFEAEIWSTMFLDEDGEPRTWITVRDVSERVRNEQEIRRIGAILAAEAEASPDGMAVFDPQGNTIAFNKRFLDIWRLEKTVITAGREAVKEAMTSLAGDSSDLREAVAADAALDLATITRELTLPDGRTILCHAAPLWARLTLLGRAWYHRDITAMKKVEHEAQATASVLTAQFAASPDGVLAAGPDGNVIAYNRQLLDMWGLTPGDMLLARPARLVRMSARVANPDAFRTLIQEQISRPGAPHHAEIPLADGRLFEQNLRELELPQGPGLAWFYRDITGHRRLAEALRAGERRLRDIVNAAVDGIIVIDSRGTIEAFSPAAAKIFGYTENEIRDRNVSTLMPEPHASEHDGYIEHYLATGDARVVGRGRELVGKRKDGSLFPLDLAVSTMGSGKNIRFVGIVRDITQRKEAEEAMVAAQKAESLAVLAGGIAHKLNNLLASINGNAAFVAMRAGVDGAAGEALRDIEASVASASALTGALLSYSGAHRPGTAATSLSAVSEEVIGLLETRRPPNVTIHSSLAEELPAVPLDPAQARELLTHLLVNALEALDDSAGGQVDLATGLMQVSRGFLDDGFVPTGLPTGEYVALEVTDNGPGIQRDVLGRLFDPFFSTKFLGRGLGLAASVGIVRGAGGAIRARNSNEGGASFLVLLPAAAAE